MHSLKIFGAVVALSSSAILLSGISECAPPTTTCFIVDPTTYLSVDELECGISPDGVSLCHWSLSFNNGEFTWMHSDYGEVGTYSCDGDTVTGKTSGATYTGTWDANEGVLTWDGVAYRQGK